MAEELPEKCIHAHEPLLKFEATHVPHAVPHPLHMFPVPRHPYLELIRLEKPTGTKLMFWPFGVYLVSFRLFIHGEAAAWGMTFAAYSQSMSLHSHVRYLGGCLFGAFIIRSSACTINDIFDHKIDACVGEYLTPCCTDIRLDKNIAIED